MTPPPFALASLREVISRNAPALGTWQVKDLHPGPADGMPGHLTNVNGTLFFWAPDGATGFELWKSDGTEDGTVLVRDIDPTDVTVPSYFQAVSDLLYFTAHTPSFGYELWRSDGTPAGTTIVKNINPTRSSYPESPAVVGDTLFFYADDGRFGDELWALGAASPATTTTTSQAPASTTSSTSLPTPTTSTSTTTSSTVVSPTTTTTTAPPVTTTTAPPATTTTSSTSTTTLPAEVCGNCADDDGDGLIDLADPACCAASGTMRLERLRIVPRRARTELTLDAAVRGIDLAPARAGQDILLQLEAPGTPPFCAHIPGTRLTAKKRALRFKDPHRTVASAGGVTRLRLHTGRNGTLSLSAQGRAIAFVPPPSVPLEVRVGFRRAGSAEGRPHCDGAGVATAPRGRR